jgi:hypothetical protein
VNTCKPWDNWRQEQRGSAIRAHRYNIVDSSILIDNRRLELFLDNYWQKCQIDPNIHYVDHKEIDASDYEKIILTLIGPSFVMIPDHRYLTISDANFEYMRNLQDDIPDYLKSEVQTLFLTKNLIN